MKIAANPWGCNIHSGTLENKRINKNTIINKGRLYQYIDRHKELI